jgi:hypothetical protein
MTLKLAKYWRHTSTRTMWAAGSDENSEGTFKWCYNATYQLMAATSLANWVLGEPNGGTFANCVESVISPTNRTDAILYNDGACLNPQTYVCEVCNHSILSALSKSLLKESICETCTFASVLLIVHLRLRIYIN